jgi:hypothetical protein
MIDTELFVHVPLSPSAPKDLYFDPVQQAWIVSRHRDVLNALRSADLSQTRPPEPTADWSAKQECQKLQANMVTALPSFPTSKWQIEIEERASILLHNLSRYRPVDLVAGFIRPWCLASAVTATGVDPAHAQRLDHVVRCLSERDAAPENVDLKYRAKEANKELDRFFFPPSASHAKSLFLGTAQTAPYFLASAWTALFQHLPQAKQLRIHPNWMRTATEELLRYAGPVHTLFRQAGKDMNIGGTKIRCGDRLILKLGSANRDPERFPEPNRLDFTRDVAGHLALSAGPHYCVGASIVRIMTAIATRAILALYSEPQLSEPVEWSCGTMLIWPSSLPVLLGNGPSCVPHECHC